MNYLCWTFGHKWDYELTVMNLREKTELVEKACSRRWCGKVWRSPRADVLLEQARERTAAILEKALDIHSREC